MKYVGFYLPFDIEDWFENVVFNSKENEGDHEFYLVEAKTPYEARRKVFEKIYKELCEFSIKVITNKCAGNMLESYSEEKVIKKYGECDGNLIIQMSNEYLDIDENKNKDEKTKFEENNTYIEKLSKNAIYELVYESLEIEIAISKLIKL